MDRIPTQASWRRAAASRRFLLIGLILVTASIASIYMAQLLPRRGGTPLEFAIVIFFGILFAWISVGFWAAVMGFFTLVRRYDRFTLSRVCCDSEPEWGGARTAILMPIFNEETDRVFAGLHATYRSVRETGHLKSFDFFVLSDSTDPDTLVEEETAWYRLARSQGELKRIFYRNRKVNIKRKSGNVADFCRRWGRDYRYMVVLDADSVMTGSTLVKMVQMMENYPDIGILQTAPTAVNRQSLIARVQQFANHVYGPMFAAGLHFWQLGDAQFWGHNAIIRVKPFMEHCALPRLPGKPPLGGDILSHDFVEAALMRRAGWGVWLAFDLGGSYEEVPPTLLEELKRDRRWAQGNMQHLRLLFTEGIFPAHRALFLNGAMSYISALLWFIFLVLSSGEAVLDAVRVPQYFPTHTTLFPNWPIWHQNWAIMLLASTAVVLFLPKLLSLLLVVLRGQTRSYGGFGRLSLSVLAETVFSTLFAPIRMLFHSKFVFITLLGQKIGWGPQQRAEQGTGWTEAFRFHGTGMLLAAIWATGMFFVSRSFFLWISPIFAPLLLSVPLSVLSSRASLGRRFRDFGLFLIPEEVDPPPELECLRDELHEREEARSASAMGNGDGFIRAVVDPDVHSLHLAFLPEERKLSSKVNLRRNLLKEKALSLGPDSLTTGEKKQLLSDPERMRSLHEAVWELPEESLAEKWRVRPQNLHAQSGQPPWAGEGRTSERKPLGL